MEFKKEVRSGRGEDWSMVRLSRAGWEVMWDSILCKSRHDHLSVHPFGETRGFSG